jgi:hypothetical protein
VDDADFFLAADGAHDPQAELAATLQALYADPAQGDAHPQCRFPARTRWLRQQLALADLPAVDCAEYRIWFDDINPHDTVLVFPAAYLNSPSSMFGHTLLRIDPPGTQADGTALLSYALNFGATTDAEDNSMLYAWKGLFGGYPGSFALLPYREKLGEYSRLENRDLWEYRLDLTPQETARLVEHVWELRQIRFDYYFFDENCSFRLLELLEVARPGIELTDPFPLTAIPADTVRAVRDAGLVTGIDYRPSRERELLGRGLPLDSAGQDWVVALADDPAQLQHPQFQQLPAAERALIQDGAYRLQRYRASGKARDAQTAASSYALLHAISTNPPPALQLPRPGQPEDGHESRTLRLAAGSREGRAFAEYGLRMAYHDLTDDQYGFPFGAQIEIGELRLRQHEDNHWQLQEFGLVSIRSLTPRNALLQPWSWQVAGGLERVPGKEGDERLVGQLNGGMGGSWMLDEEALGFALLTTRLERNPDLDGWLTPAAGFDSGLLWRNAAGNLLLEARGDWFSSGEIRRRIELTQQIELGRDLGVQLGISRQFSQLQAPATEVRVELRHYFY